MLCVRIYVAYPFLPEVSAYDTYECTAIHTYIWHVCIICQRRGLRTTKWQLPTYAVREADSNDESWSGEGKIVSLHCVVILGWLLVNALRRGWKKHRPAIKLGLDGECPFNILEEMPGELESWWSRLFFWIHGSFTNAICFPPQRSRWWILAPRHRCEPLSTTSRLLFAMCSGFGCYSNQQSHSIPLESSQMNKEFFQVSVFHSIQTRKVKESNSPRIGIAPRNLQIQWLWFGRLPWSGKPYSWLRTSCTKDSKQAKSRGRGF